MCMIEVSPTIETRRLALRAPVIEDAPRIAALLNDLDVARMTARMPHPYTSADAEDFVVRAMAADPRTERVFLIELEDQGVVGNLHFFPSAEGYAEVGYSVGKAWWGRGIATEALQGGLAWAGREWRKRMIIAGHFADNPASGGVLVKAGFLYTGEVRQLASRARGGTAPSRMMVWLA
ncbi:GNAT family N-acetyltransferase [Caulobacter mirabilis]|uniref:GNAT family N-acetyltransferase n=1 Tax=Caulobacter mirabilis TaxID=69666 RepID=A0A2D2AT85_9CAUL|nr:GNAT family N-acetyltransferase [Caulobacter mirabilis]ATQ41220.1 GNAT family N-acetyltransferase [Caulobacter mirabilis]